MTKELTPLEALNKLRGMMCNNCPFNYEDMDGEKCQECEEKNNIIETALKRLKEWDKILVEQKINVNSLYDFLDDVEENLKKLKALEIIKEKMVNVCAFISWNNIVNFTYEKYQELQLTYLISAKRLTKEEFDLLKEYYCK